MPQPTQEELNKLRREGEKTVRKLTEAQRKLLREPLSDSRRMVEPVIASKLALAAELQVLFTLAGALTISPDQIKNIRKRIKANLGPRGPIRLLLRLLIGLIRDIVEGVIGILVDIGKELAAIFEESFGDAEIEELDADTFKLEGKTDNLRLRFSESLQRFGFPAESEPFAGSWSATVVTDGTDAEGNKRYRVIQYASTPGDISLGPATLRGVRQTLDPEEESLFIVNSAREVNGVLYTRFLSENWKDDVLGIPAITTVDGSIAGNVFNYHSVGEDFLWVTYLLPELEERFEPVGRPTVVNTSGIRSDFSPDRFILSLVRTGIPLEIAERLNEALERSIPSDRLISTLDVRRVGELARENPFDRLVAEMLGGNR